MPVSGTRDVSIVLMIIHQFVAYALYVTPVFFMWEKLIKTHQKPLWIRLPSRLPVCKFSACLQLFIPCSCNIYIWPAELACSSVGWLGSVRAVVHTCPHPS